MQGHFSRYFSKQAITIEGIWPVTGDYMNGKYTLQLVHENTDLFTKYYPSVLDCWPYQQGRIFVQGHILVALKRNVP